MKLSTLLIATSLLLVGVTAIAPTGAADRCGFSDPDLEQAVCTPYYVGMCLAYAAGSPKHLKEQVPYCATILYLP